MNPNLYIDQWRPNKYHEIVAAMGREFDPGDFDHRDDTDHWRTHRAFGGGMERLFPGGKPTAAAFPPHSIRPGLIDREAVRDAVTKAIRGIIHPEHIDPRWLHMTQTTVTNSGVHYYLNGNWEHTGETFADQHLPGNRFPIVYQTGGRYNARLILSGHHRATAALVSGRGLSAVLVRAEG